MSFLEQLISGTKKYDFRASVLISLALQFVLLIAAPFRKRSSFRELLCVVWGAYLVSDWASNFAVGLIPVNRDSQAARNDVGSDIVMLWAPFLLLHMGGVDSIAALSSTDNELCSRFSIQLATMIYGIGNAFYRSFVESKLRVLVLLMFVAGLTRYLERILALSQARLSSFKESLIQEKSESSKMLTLELKEEDLNNYSNELSDAKMLRDAYYLFQSFKALFVDLHVDSEDRKKSREYFQRRNPIDAFRVVEIELNFSYDLFYTKVQVIRHGLGRFLRPISIISEVITLVLWFRMDKRSIRKFDVRGTYALLLGAVARDLISLLILIFSDWTIASIVRKSDDSKLVNNCLSFRKQRWDNYDAPIETPFLILVSRTLLRRWSESTPLLNFIDLCLDHRAELKDRASEVLGIDFALNKCRRVSYNQWFGNDLRDFIFEELKNKSNLLDASQSNIGVTRGQWTLENYRPGVEELSSLSNVWILEKMFDESLLMWHIATNLCYYNEEEIENPEVSEKKSRTFSMILSDNMLYLLLRRPEMMMEAAAMGEMRFDETRDEAKGYFRSFYERNGDQSSLDNEEEFRRIRSACTWVLNEFPIESEEEEEDEVYSVLYDACRLAKELKGLKERQVIEMWEVIAKVWVEMLSYGAARCSPSAHVAELANGSELLTLVWLLMEHLGLAK